MIKTYKKDGHIIYNGDAIQVLESKIEDKSIDLIFVDPPYNIGKDFNGRKDKWNTDLFADHATVRVFNRLF